MWYKLFTMFRENHTYVVLIRYANIFRLVSSISKSKCKKYNMHKCLSLLLELKKLFSFYYFQVVQMISPMQSYKMEKIGRVLFRVVELTTSMINTYIIKLMIIVHSTCLCNCHHQKRRLIKNYFVFITETYKKFT